ncbi:MAG: signal recognition particle protein [Coriobacteriales bacterium]|jgi:signal recognition particle subunit SRP54|nr:signal recognition particle protein [Coriobacteriales bacterium]
MFDNLSERLQNVFSGLKSKGRLSEADIDEAMREIRLALLEADVNFKVVKGFVARAKERALATDVMQSLTPGQNVVKIVLEELTDLLDGGGTGGANGEDGTPTPSQPQQPLQFSSRIPNAIMLVGLQGSGKTTAATKLAYRLKDQGHSPLLVAADVYRPAAADQLETLGHEINVPVFRGDGISPVAIAKGAVREAIDTLHDVIIVDTAGRLHVDEDMMNEAAAIKDAIEPEHILMVVDAMTGQDVVTVVQAFAEKVDFDGVILSKMDGDARGGGALSVRAVTGKPILFTSEGEKPESLEEFHADRLAKRILGMGDVVSFIEKVQQTVDEEAEAEKAERLARAELTFDDFISVSKKIRKIGGIASVLKAVPGGEKALGSGKVDEKILDRMEVIIGSMTKAERAKPSVINGSRRARIAKGAGVEVAQVNQLVKQFDDMRHMLKKMGVAVEQIKPRKKRPRKGGKKNKQKRARMPKMPAGAMGGMKGVDFKSLGDMLS